MIQRIILGKFRKSKKRDRILEILRGTSMHPTADWIFNRLKKDYPHLSLGTVYRNLHILIEQGLVKKIEAGSTFDRFEANTGLHYHFVCENCGKIVDLALPIDHSLNEMVNNTTQFHARYHKLEFFGHCDKCDEDAYE